MSTAPESILAREVRPRPDRVQVPIDSLEAAREIDRTSRPRRTTTPVRKLFVRSDDDTPTPLSRLYGPGGRGGSVAVKLYLALLWRCSGGGHDTQKPARSWATLLGLPDAETKGARRINDALKKLKAERLVSVDYVPGEGNKVTILDESGDGSDYGLPSTAYARAPAGEAGEARRARNRYFQLPSRLWTEGDIQSLPGPGLVMLLILLAEQADKADFAPVRFPTTAFPKRYRISHKVRAQGTRQLRDRGLLDVDREPVPEIRGRVFERRRYRSLYTLTLPGEDETPAPQDADEPDSGMADPT